MMGKMISKELSEKIANLSFACSILVVMIHLGESWEPASTRFMSAVFANGLCAIAVPYFFIVSGYFLGKVDYRAALRKRIRTLAVPYLIWQFLAMLFFCFLAVVGNAKNGRPLMACIDFSVASLASDLGVWGQGLSCAPSHGALWYVRALLLFVMSLPLIRGFVRRVHWYGVGILWLLGIVVNFRWVSLSQWWYGFFYWTFPLQGLVFFAAGLLLAIHPVPAGIGRRIAKYALVLALAALAWEIYSLAYSGRAVSVGWRFLYVPGILSAIWYAMPAVHLPRWLTDLSFPLYILHYFFAIVYWFYLPRWTSESVVMYFVKFFVAVCGSIVLALALRRLMPRFYTISFGGRG